MKSSWYWINHIWRSSLILSRWLFIELFFFKGWISTWTRLFCFPVSAQRCLCPSTESPPSPTPSRSPSQWCRTEALRPPPPPRTAEPERTWPWASSPPRDQPCCSLSAPSASSTSLSSWPQMVRTGITRGNVVVVQPCSLWMQTLKTWTCFS